MLKKWKKAVIHLECLNSDKESEIDENIQILKAKLENKEISQEDYDKEIKELFNIQKYHGTALFLNHNSERFLITARHVVFDEESAKRKIKEEIDALESLEEYQKSIAIRNITEDLTSTTIFNRIFRVQSFDEFKSNIEKGTPIRIPISLNNLGDDPTRPFPFIFSEFLDLAVISLNREETKDFAEELLDLGYEPVSTNDILKDPTSEGCDIFTVGFPGSVTTHKMEDFTEWSLKVSPYFSFPNFSFGKVSMLHDFPDYFWADISVAPGNSGGPVIQNDKLVGIVNGQAMEPIDLPFVYSTSAGIPFAKVTKAGYLRALLTRQIESDYFVNENGERTINNLIKKLY